MANEEHTPKIVWNLLKETANEWSRDQAPRLGAALAYYATFSLAPLLIIAVSISGLVFGREAATGQIVGVSRAWSDRIQPGLFRR